MNNLPSIAVALFALATGANASWEPVAQEAPTWQPLHDGETQDGWRAIGGGEWVVEEGMIVGTQSAEDPSHGLLLGETTYGDFSLRMQVRATQGNSGIYFRAEEGGGAGVVGFQAEVDPTKDCGGLYETGGRGWVIKPSAEDHARVFRSGEWNDYAVHARGRDVWVIVNGEETARLTNDPGRLKGRIALQLHGGQDVRVEFRALEIAIPGPDDRVLLDGEVLGDPRANKLITLDGYFPFEPPLDAGQWESRRSELRRQLLVAAGLWPLPTARAPVEATVHGLINRGEYTVEKVYFESRPGFVLTGSLYRPTGITGRLPAVLSPHGHQGGGRQMLRSSDDAANQIANGWESDPAAARSYMQARCVQLARMGMIVFHYDMVGFADSSQLSHTDEFDDVASLLDGRSHFGLQTWNSIRALDFLAELPDVDPQRIGVTGASGGGTQTFVLCAIDERPAAALPAVMVSTAMQGGCVCENAPHLRVGTGNVELAAAIAPRPLGLTWANDWTLELPSKGIPELLALYDTLGKRDHIAWEGSATFEHNYNASSRAFMYRFFREHLGMPSDASLEETAFELIAPEDLSVWGQGHPAPGPWDPRIGVGAAHEDYREVLLQSSVEDYDRDVGGALSTLLHASLPEPGDAVASTRYEGWRQGVRITKAILSRRGEAARIPVVLRVPDEWNGTVCVLVNDDGKRSDAEEVLRSITGAGAAVLSIDVLQTGEHLSDPSVPGPPLAVDRSRHGRYAGYTWGYNRTLIAERVSDVLVAIGWARDIEGVRAVSLFGRGDAGGWVVLASALAGDAVTRTAAEWSWTFGDIDRVTDPNLLPGALRYGGLPAFAGLIAPSPLRLTSVRELPELTQARYAATGNPDALGVGQNAALLSWLAEEPE